MRRMEEDGGRFKWAMAEKNRSDHGSQLNNMAYFSSINSSVWATIVPPLVLYLWRLKGRPVLWSCTWTKLSEIQRHQKEKADAEIKKTQLAVSKNICYKGFKVF